MLLERLAVLLNKPEDGAPAIRELFDALPACVAYCGDDLRYRLVNRCYELWFGSPRGEIVGKTVPEVIGPRAFAATELYVRRVLSGRRVDRIADIHYPPPIGPQRVRMILIPDTRPDGKTLGYFVLILPTLPPLVDAMPPEQALPEDAPG